MVRSYIKYNNSFFLFEKFNKQLLDADGGIDIHR